ncbi:unnamed protein product [Brugia timori]|uniref:Uncharacterized protein n=1 Tax=Brugia timori TaxID=42155 RepID=A0A0R3QMG7_9BILA|nr:unnamed protein product [Brugia timori]
MYSYYNDITDDIIPVALSKTFLIITTLLLFKEYAKEQEVKHRRRIILPCVIPWEYGTNKYASQKGTGGFGTIRNAIIQILCKYYFNFFDLIDKINVFVFKLLFFIATTIKCSKQLSESNDGVVPWMNCPQLRDKELASQAGLTPFGGIREHVIKVQDKEGEKKKDINKIVCDQTSESILKIWSQANPDAKNGQLFGKHRDAVMEVKGGREFNQKELNASRAAIPKFQDPRETLAAKAKKANNITLQSQPYQDDIQMSHNIITKSKPYFDRVMSERKYGIEKIMEAKVQCHQKRKGNGMMGKKFKLGERERRLNEVQMEDEK